MYLHLGQNVVVPESSVIGIFDLDNTSWSHITRKFLAKASSDGSVVSVTEDLPKSFVVCSEPAQPHNGETRIYLSQLSSQTLLKRSETMRFE